MSASATIIDHNNNNNTKNITNSTEKGDMARLEEEKDEFLTQRSYDLLLIDSLKKISEIDRNYSNFESNDFSSKSSAFHSILRLSARLNTLRLLSNSREIAINYDEEKYRNIFEKNFTLNPNFHTLLSREQFQLFDFVFNNSLAFDYYSKISKEASLSEQPASSSPSPPVDSNQNQNSQKKLKLTFNCVAFFSLIFAQRCFDSKNFKKCAKICELLCKCDSINNSLNSQNSSNSLIHSILLEKCFFLFALSHEKIGDLPQHRILLQQLLSLSSKRKQYAHQAVLINAILRSYLLENAYDLANKFASKVEFPYDAHSDQWARYHFYLGKICALKASYNESYRHFIEASRKSPSGFAFDFQNIVAKNLLIVTLLLGNLPDKNLFKQNNDNSNSNNNSMKAYRSLSAAVVQGKLKQFNEVLKENRREFLKDSTLSLILRLPNNVLKMALKSICKSYSQISLDDVAKRLELSDAGDVHYILQNAIMNNVIQARINENDILETTNEEDLYSSAKPSKFFNDRTEFCSRLFEKTRRAMKHIQKSRNAEDDVYDDDYSNTNFEFDLFNNFSDMSDDF